MLDLLPDVKTSLSISKPNTPTGMLEVEKEDTVRGMINFKKTQNKSCISVGKCEFDQHTVLLRDYQTQETFYLTTSLNDLGPKEWYAIDVGKESCQASQNLDIMKEKKIKGFSAFSKAVQYNFQIILFKLLPSDPPKKTCHPLPSGFEANSAEKLPNPNACLGLGITSREKCPAPILTGATSVSECPEMTDAIVALLQSGLSSYSDFERWIKIS
ncbi:hypothetical protein E2I00_015364 [Balaenoptera physalus]|uniref:Cordon-bleu ubiquitin-like domain-containing protein n=1 Tax=Balaenoptera physalus TaxID=9770 RepID=A0A643CAF7_BALPH|nr:hypothetical protein E2I00_015364 [Balaenoptera physalus]